VSPPRHRLTVVLIIASVLGLALIAWARAPGTAVVAGSPASVRIAVPLDPVDLVASLAATELRSSVDPRHVGGPLWPPTMIVTLLAAVVAASMMGATAPRVDRWRIGLGPPRRGPPSV